MREPVEKTEETSFSAALREAVEPALATGPWFKQLYRKPGCRKTARFAQRNRLKFSP
jgi:hypothetical protein